MFINTLKTTSIKNELHQKESKKDNSDEKIISAEKGIFSATSKQ